ncbi:hypothetical protein U8C36_12240 [Sinorhizobium medicae]|uniref:hypothetical protein n=1 Tax=Sinorhizobium medicae TaxID=110321 RepID=UPI002AF6B584|nr:hypothetical protein [Sinorhizobium medicae]WQO50730.1 hypothetical protein U8C36_12240 [Sinorhizobium medicae]
MPNPYRVVEYDSGPKGMPGMETLINEWAAKGYQLDQAVRESTYRWVLFFSLKANVRTGRQFIQIRREFSGPA